MFYSSMSESFTKMTGVCTPELLSRNIKSVKFCLLVDTYLIYQWPFLFCFSNRREAFFFKSELIQGLLQASKQLEDYILQNKADY